MTQTIPSRHANFEPNHCDGSTEMLGAKPEYRAMIAVDVEKSAGRGNVALMMFREALFAAVREACAASGIDWNACHRADLGDGLRLVGPRGLPKAAFVYPFTNNLADRLLAHNRSVEERARIRVRMAMHAGDVYVQDGTVAGSPFEFLARMLDAPPFKNGLAAAPESTTVGLIVSLHIYDDVIRQRYEGIDLDAFRPVKFTVKETTATAWVRLPAIVPLDSAAEPDSGPSAGNAHYLQNVSATTAYTVQGGTMNIGREER